MTTQEMAERIVDTLFHDGAGRVADRLMLIVLPSRTDYGGWSRGPAIDAVRRVLEGGGGHRA